MPKKTIKIKIRKPRNPMVLAARSKIAAPMKDRRLSRGGSKNESRDLMSERNEDKE